MELPSPLELMVLADSGAVEVVTYGQDGDPFIVAHDRLEIVRGTLMVERRVRTRAPAEFILIEFTA